MESKWLKTAFNIDRRLPIFLFFVPWSVWFIYRASFTLDGIRYFCLIDDAMISMAGSGKYLNGRRRGVH